MIIKKLSTDQFAGISDKEIEFADGVNVVFGKNEAGKSTLVSLLSGVLFKDVRLKMNLKADREFADDFFPAKKADGKISGNTINGTVIISDGDGDCKIVKEWGDEPSCKLTGGVMLKGAEKVGESLQPILKYGEGVYRELLLAPQKAADDNLRELLDASVKTDSKAVFADAVSKAFAQSDGISLDKVEERLEEKIAELSGAHWDIENRCPAGNKRFQKSTGAVLKALYAWEDAQNALDELLKLEEELDESAAELSQKELAAAAAQSELDEFDKFAGELAALNANRAKLLRLNGDIKRFEQAASDLPKNKTALEQTLRLQVEKSNRDILDLYSAAKSAKDKLDAASGELAKIMRPADEEIQAVKNSEKRIQKLENSLCEMNIAAKIKTLGGNSVVVRSVRTGEEISAADGVFALSEAVSIEIPGVLEMEIAPADVEADKVKAAISELNAAKNAVFGKYGCASEEELNALAKRYDEMSYAVRAAENELNAILGENDLDELKREADELSAIGANVRELYEIEADIAELCGGNAESYAVKLQTQIDAFESEYGSPTMLDELLSNAKKERDEAESSVMSADRIPEKYRDISDAEAKREELKRSCEQARNAREQAAVQKSRAQTLFEGAGQSSDELRENAEALRREYDEKVAELYNWVHIREVFLSQKSALADNPLHDLAEKFGKYLALISDDRISPRFGDSGKPDFTLTGGDNLIDFRKLSDGSKDAVYLAFRLAALDYLFPEGGGVIVLDDPMSDMDDDRVKRSCKLINACGERHQVIVLTCREEYSSMLGGNVITV